VNELESETISLVYRFKTNNTDIQSNEIIHISVELLLSIHNNAI